MTKQKRRQIGRDALTGKFISVNKAKRRKATAVVETLPPPQKKSTKKK